MATECYKIEWTGFYSLSEANSRPEAKKLGLYVVFRRTSSGSRIPLYIGKATEIGTRLNKHRQEWQQILSPSVLNKLQIAIGVLTSLDGKPVTQKQLSDIEKLVLYEEHPERNAPSTKKAYTGRSLIVVNTGKMGRFITTHDKRLLKLIKVAR
jgi:hypothetical protein